MARSKEKNTQVGRDKVRAQTKQITPKKQEPPLSNDPRLPPLAYRFHDALIEDVVLGPRRKLILTLKPLLWVGNQGHRGPAVTVQMSAIVNYEEVEAIFSRRYHLISELRVLDYDPNHASKLDDLYLYLDFERVEANVVIHCDKLTLTEAEPQIPPRDE